MLAYEEDVFFFFPPPNTGSFHFLEKDSVFSFLPRFARLNLSRFSISLLRRDMRIVPAFFFPPRTEPLRRTSFHGSRYVPISPFFSVDFLFSLISSHREYKNIILSSSPLPRVMGDRLFFFFFFLNLIVKRHLCSSLNIPAFPFFPKFLPPSPSSSYGVFRDTLLIFPPCDKIFNAFFFPPFTGMGILTPPPSLKTPFFFHPLRAEKGFPSPSLPTS